MKVVMAGRYLKQRTKQSLSNVVGIRKRASRERQFELLGHKLFARRSKVRDGTGLKAELRNRTNEA